jgi:hypothetical protein
MRTDKGMVFERTIRPDVLEVAYRIAGSDTPFEDQRQLLAVALRDHVTEQEANNKTKKMMTRVWVNPPEEATNVIHWAVQHPEAFPDRYAMHLGAMLATYPFVDTVLATLGRAFALEGSITGVELRRKVVGQWGERTSVSLGATKTAGTLRHLRIISGGGNAGPYRPAAKLDVSSMGAAWLVHCLLCSRGAGSINADDVDSAPELFWTVPLTVDHTYPMLELHREGMNRRVWAIR